MAQDVRVVVAISTSIGFVVTLMPSICYIVKFESRVIFRQDAQKTLNSINIILLLFSFDH